jgi:carbamoyl-phosphate synthase large subunit
MKILFLGASRLVGYLERFRVAAIAEDVDLEMSSVEDGEPWHAIAAAGLCELIAGPAFLDDQFGPFLVETVRDRSIDIVIPNIDPATVGLARSRDELAELGVLPLVSEPMLCRAMFDKREAARFFRDHGLPVPSGDRFPRIAKPRFGSGSKDHVLFHDAEELDFWRSRNDEEDFLVEPYLEGTEYTIDAYVGRDGELVDAVSRIRLQVAAGEVMVTATHRNEDVLRVARRVLGVAGWFGPITVQVIDGADGPHLIEVNPRSGGGVPCSIEAGLDVPRWILREALGRQLPTGPLEWKDGLCLTRARKDYYLWLS